ncbi:hypothetical protein [Sagittula salina]|uniref:Autotransporter domain-containing protein n=1 Tax=Sagittula salina TaxID=2820268 RepID=A0A940MTS9_9RHOB|nr:hypothetical protein [Sagittula salina]MBP0483837.1 hypothetical protein [Sagittula salina]
MKLLAATAFALLPLAAAAQAVDPATLSQSDLLGREIGFGLASSALDAQRPGIWTMGSTARTVASPPAAQSSDVLRRNAVAGYGFGQSGVSAFLGYGQAASDLSNDREEARIRSYFLGLAYAGETPHMRYGATAYVGRSHNVVDAPDALTGSADHDGRLTGLSGRITTQLSGTPQKGVDLTIQGDLLRHETRDFTVTGYGGQTVGARESTASRLRAELGMPMQLRGWSLRPYAAMGLYGGNQDDLNVGTATIGASDAFGTTQFSLGTGFAARNGVGGRVEMSVDKQGEAGALAGIGFHF